jgi:transmembrane sensor
MDANERRSRASEEAAQWWTILQGDATRGQREQFVDWLRESAVHVAEMLRVAQVHGALDQFQRWAQLPTDGSADGDRGSVIALPARRPAPEVFDSKARQLRLRWAAAAAVATVAVLTAWLVPALRGQIIQTERGERREVALADGSVVQVDPQSRLRVRFEQSTRRVFLERGRALFRVAPNPKRPFEVHAEGMLVRAIGTAFGVERSFAGLVVTVAEGRVAVLPRSAADLPPAATAPTPTAPQSVADPRGDEMPAANVPPESVLLTAGHQLTVPRSGSADPVREVNSGKELAWAHGSLVFENDTLADVVAQFNRYNRVQLHVADDALLKRRISAVFEASDLESFLAFIQAAAPVSVERSGDEGITLALRQ